MIKDSDITKEYQYIETSFSKHFENQLIPAVHAQIFSGMRRLYDQADPAGCIRNKLLFRTYDVIAEYCFDCYKIEIQPTTVVDLFKLLMLFKTYSFPRNNTRKCFLRPGKENSSHYSGLIYFKNLKEAKSMLNDINAILTENIGKSMHAFIKRGCNDFAEKHPAYAELNKDYEPILKSNKEWKKIEEKFNKEGLAKDLAAIPKGPHPKGYTFQDYLSMRAWLSYAKTIGDESYKIITETPVNIIPDLDPAPFVST